MDDQSVTPAEGWANREVRASFPAGTDPLAAIRETLGVFFERADGSNAMPWWTRCRWWHGGQAGIHRGAILRPPAETGIVPGLDTTDKASVYVTASREEALLFALRHQRPMLYEVVVDVEPVPDDLLPDHAPSKRVPSARVIRVEQPSNREVSMAMAMMLRSGPPPTLDEMPPLD